MDLSRLRIRMPSNVWVNVGGIDRPIWVYLPYELKIGFYSVSTYKNKQTLSNVEVQGLIINPCDLPFDKNTVFNPFAFLILNHLKNNSLFFKERYNTLSLSERVYSCDEPYVRDDEFVKLFPIDWRTINLDFVDDESRILTKENLDYFKTPKDIKQYANY